MTLDKTILERLLRSPSSSLELSVRVTNCLESVGITTVKDLVIVSEEDFIRRRAFRVTTVEEVKQQLKPYGLRLGMKFTAAGKLIIGDHST